MILHKNLDATNYGQIFDSISSLCYKFKLIGEETIGI